MEFGAALLAERERWPLWVPVLLGVGISLYFAQTDEPPTWFGSLTLLGTVGCAFLLRNEPRGFLATIIIALVAAGYLLMTGGTIPTQRAFLMITLALLAIVFDRVPISMTIVAWAAIGILLSSPEILLSASFQMSFAAVVALIAAYEALGRHILRFRSRAGPWRRGGLYIGGVMLTTLIAGLATAPFAAFHFNRVATYSLAGNLVAVPVMALWIMPWALVTYLLFPLGWQELALAPMAWGIGVVLEVAESVASWPGAVRLVPAMPVAFLGLMTLGGLWLCLWNTRLRILGIVCM